MQAGGSRSGAHGDAPLLPHGWERSWNSQYNTWYYFNRQLGLSQW